MPSALARGVARRPHTQPRRFRQPLVPREWRHRLEPQIARRTRRRRIVRGALARIRGWLWWPLPWAIALHVDPGHGSLVVGARDGPDGGAQPGDRAARPGPGLRRRSPDAGRDGRLPRQHGRLDRLPAPARQQDHDPQQRRRVLPVDARGDSRRPPLDHDRGLHLLAGRHRAGVRARDRRAGQGGPAGEAAPRRGRFRHHRRRDPESPRGRRLPARLVQPDRLVHARSLQLPDPSQVADHRRLPGLHRRGRHRRPLARLRAGPGALARHADPDRRPGRDPAADRLRAELAADDGGTGERARVLPPAQASGGCVRHDGAELAVGRRLTRADALLPGHRLRQALDPDRQPVLRARPGGGGRVARRPAPAASRSR